MSNLKRSKSPASVRLGGKGRTGDVTAEERRWRMLMFWWLTHALVGGAARGMLRRGSLCQPALGREEREGLTKRMRMGRASSSIRLIASCRDTERAVSVRSQRRSTSVAVGDAADCRRQTLLRVCRPAVRPCMCLRLAIEPVTVHGHLVPSLPRRAWLVSAPCRRWRSDCLCFPWACDRGANQAPYHFFTSSSPNRYEWASGDRHREDNAQTWQ